eukprot:Transcript_16790.p1 GENE.Transcript_16790~~Transcript_16790.p1  ORF type:complete len:321 (-),score=117.36 Transcript_16790:235-1113(-)
MTRTGTDASSMRSTKPIGGAATTADIVAAHKGGQKKQSTAARLNALVDQFQAFYGGLEQDVITEYEQEEDRLTAVERYVLRLQKSLVVEQTRRIEMLSHVEENLKQQFEVVWQRNKTQVEALRPEIPRRIEQWHARLCADEEILEEERIARGIAIEKERQRLLKQLEDFKERLEIEKVERLEREALTLKKVTDSSFPLQESIADERNRRESMLGHLRDEIDQADEMRNKPDKIFKDDLITRMVRATKDIKLETSVRVAAEQQFVSSLESYTKALQEGLRMVNKQVDEEGARR